MPKKYPDSFCQISNKYVLKLKKNMYGLTDASLMWHEHCTQGLIEQGFQCLMIDPCLFYKSGLVMILFVDDVCIFGTSKELINNFIELLKRSEN